MKILVGGLLESQQRHLKKACPENVELRFVGADRDPQVWRRMGKNCDICILITDFVNHKHGEAWAAAGCHVVRHTGGVSRLKELIAEIAQQNRAP